MNPRAATPSGPEVLGWLQRRRRRLWSSPIIAALMAATQAAFLTWILLNISYLSGCWEIMREMESGALKVAPYKQISTLMPLWIALGSLLYTLAWMLLLRAWRIERRYLILLQQTFRGRD